MRKVPGRMIKWLSDDQKEGFRARLVNCRPAAAPQNHSEELL